MSEVKQLCCRLKAQGGTLALLRAMGVWLWTEVSESFSKKAQHQAGAKTQPGTRTGERLESHRTWSWGWGTWGAGVPGLQGWAGVPVSLLSDGGMCHPREKEKQMVEGVTVGGKPN